MKPLRSAITAFSMYSSIPMPNILWSENTMDWALCFFPLVGVVIGLLLLAWLRFADAFAISNLLRGAVTLAIPIAVSGGIHLDGFCDTADALASNLSRERRLEILKDTHTGAFAIIACASYLVLLFAACSSVSLYSGSIQIIALIPVLSRALSGLAAVSIPNARRSGLLAAFTEHAHVLQARIIFLLWIAAAAAAMIAADFALGIISLSVAACVSVYYVILSISKFGGITGDLEGFFLQINELALFLAAALYSDIAL